MKQIIQNIGLIIFLIAIIMLAVALLVQDRAQNTILIVSGTLIVVGLVVHVIVNKILD